MVIELLSPVSDKASHSQSLGTILEILNFPETVQVFSNPTPITQSSISLLENKNQPSLA